METAFVGPDRTGPGRAGPGRAGLGHATGRNGPGPKLNSGREVYGPGRQNPARADLWWQHKAFYTVSAYHNSCKIPSYLINFDHTQDNIIVGCSQNKSLKLCLYRYKRCISSTCSQYYTTLQNCSCRYRLHRMSGIIGCRSHFIYLFFRSRLAGLKILLVDCTHCWREV